MKHLTSQPALPKVKKRGMRMRAIPAETLYSLKLYDLKFQYFERLLERLSLKNGKS